MFGKRVLEYGPLQAIMNFVNSQFEQGLEKWYGKYLISEKNDPMERWLNVSLEEGEAPHETPLHIAAKMNLVSTTTALVGNKANVNAIDEDGDTAMHIAIRNNHIEVFSELIKSEIVDFSIRNNKGLTVLHELVLAGNEDMFIIILSLDIDMDLEDSRGVGVEDFAREVGNNRIEDMIRSWREYKNFRLSYVPSLLGDAGIMKYK